MLRYSDKNDVNLSNHIICQTQSFQLYSSLADQFWKEISFNEKNDGKQERTRKCILEWFLPRSLPAATPPPPPPTFLERIWKAIRWEGIVMTRDVISSSAASVVSVLFTHPLEVLKMHYLSKMQSKQKSMFFSRSLNFFYEIRNIYKDHGISRFYRGHMGSQRDSLFQTVSMFYTQQRVYQQLEKEGLGKYPGVCSFISGFLSATFAVVALKPIDEHRNRQLRKRMLLTKYGPIQAAYEIRRRESFLQLFRGCFPEFMYLGTQYGLRFWLYNEIRDLINERKTEALMSEMAPLDPNGDYNHYRIEPIKHLSYGESMLAGAASGVLGDIVSHPLDVVSSRLHTGALRRQHFNYDETCRHYFQCIRLLWKNTSLRGLYTGLTPSLIKSMASVGLQFAVYDNVEARLEPIFDTSLS